MNGGSGPVVPSSVSLLIIEQFPPFFLGFTHPLCPYCMPMHLLPFYKIDESGPT